jgi:hypothetical protein
MVYICVHCDHRLYADVDRCPGCGQAPWRELAIPRISYNGEYRRNDGKGKAIFQFNQLVIQNTNGRVDRFAYADLDGKYGEYVYSDGRFYEWTFRAFPSETPAAVVIGFPPPPKGADSYDRYHSSIQPFMSWLEFYVDHLGPKKTVQQTATSAEVPMSRREVPHPSVVQPVVRRSEMDEKFQLHNGSHATLGSSSIIITWGNSIEQLNYRILRRVWPEDNGLFTKKWEVKYDRYDTVVTGSLRFQDKETRDRFLEGLQEAMM